MAKILLVEDDALIRDLIALRLQNHQFDVVAASDGQEGVLLAKSEKPDLILMDMRMPIMDGWEAIEQIKAWPQTAAIPIIALTAQSAAIVNQRKMKVRYDGYAQKPLKFKRLLSQIESLIQNRVVA